MESQDLLSLLVSLPFRRLYFFYRVGKTSNLARRIANLLELLSRP